MIQLSHPYMNTGKTIALSRRTFVGKVMSLLLVLAQEAVLSSIQKRACLSRALSPVRLKPEEKAPGILEALWPSPSPLALSSVARGEASSLSRGLEGRGLGAVTPRARSPTHVGASACARSRKKFCRNRIIKACQSTSSFCTGGPLGMTWPRWFQK